jgi:hypothetical protein
MKNFLRAACIDDILATINLNTLINAILGELDRLSITNRGGDAHLVNSLD